MPDYLGDPVLLPLRARSPFVTIGRGRLCVEDHSLLVVDEGSETELPAGMISTVLLEPGVTVTHEAVKLAAEQGTLLLWVGEAGVRVYSAGQPGGRAAGRLLSQASIHLDQHQRLAAAYRLYSLMFEESMPETRSLDKLRGLEGARVKSLYREIAGRSGVQWTDRANAPRYLRDALGFATSCLYGLSEAVILAAGYSPAIGIIHSGDPRSLVFDLADTVKFKTVIPEAFAVFSESTADIPGRVRRKCRDVFREQRMAETLFDNLFIVMGEDGPGSESE